MALEMSSEIVEVPLLELSLLKQAVASCSTFFNIISTLETYQHSDDRMARKLRGHYLGAFVDVIKSEHPDWNDDQILAFIHGTEFTSTRSRASMASDFEWLIVPEEVRRSLLMAVDYHKIGSSEFNAKYGQAESVSGKVPCWVGPMSSALERHYDPKPR